MPSIRRSSPFLQPPNPQFVLKKKSNVVPVSAATACDYRSVRFTRRFCYLHNRRFMQANFGNRR